MNKYFKEFLHRGLIFGGFGPIITAIIMLILQFTVTNFSFDGYQMFVSVISTYLLAFVHAGSSVFNQIEHWSIMKSLFCQLGTLYVAYVGCYLINSWLPSNLIVIAIFTAIFVITYFVIWAIVYFCVKNHAKKLSEKLA